ncbi:MAG: biopolymer transporter ExbD [Phycisphaera sp.]|nr:biopolymer transporter ExbD [Phycisphaera sp.]
MSVASRLGVGRPVRTGANLTPMIDMTFLLVVFFILVSRITSVEQVPLELPSPAKPAANPAPEAPRLVVNVPADEAGEAIGILLDQRVYDFDGTSIEAFTQTVAVRLEAIPEMQVNLRADRRIPYETVEPVMEALARAGGLAGRSDGVRVNLVIQIDEGGDT